MQAIVDDAAVEFCQKSLPHTAVEASLDCTARALKSMMPRPVGDAVIFRVRKISTDAADALTRLTVVTETVKRGHRHGKASEKIGLRRSRTAVAKRILKLADKTVAKKVEFLQRCKYLGMSADESDTFSGTAPLAASLQGCSPTFGWMNSMVGQINVAGSKDGEGLHNACRKLINNFQRVGMIDIEPDTPDLWSKVTSTCFDGASAMRSTSYYAGLDSNPGGTSMHAYMKKSINNMLPNLHGLCHSSNLAFKDTIKSEATWVDTWLLHIKTAFNWFSKSPGRKHSLRELHKVMCVLRNVVTWRLVLPKYYCPTRWLGIHRALEALVAVWPLMEEYAADLMSKGYRPDRRTKEDDDEETLVVREAMANARCVRRT